MEKETIEALLGQYGWMLIAGFLFLIGRKTIESSIEAIKVFAGDDLNTDDVIIFDDRPARVVRVGFWKTDCSTCLRNYQVCPRVGVTDVFFFLRR